VLQYALLDGARTAKRRRKIARRIHNRVDDMHWKLAHWLLRNYRAVIIPRLYVARATSLNKRHMRYMRHCRFVDRLCLKSQEYPGSAVYMASEAYTTIQCGRCFVLNRQTRKAEVFQCKQCGLRMDRDVHASRNETLGHLG